jgi:hypothetical protein
VRRTLIQSILFLICFFLVERFCYDKTLGFRLQKIYSTLPPDPNWATGYLKEYDEAKVREILSQPFYFFGRGGESYAFLSKDGRYILKFFKHHKMRPKHPLDLLLPPCFRQKWQNRRKERLERFFSSCKLAFEQISQETGLLYLHLTKSENLHQKMTFFDPIGIKHRVDLDKVEFALQKRATMALPTLFQLVEEGKVDLAKAHLTSLLEMIYTRSRAGIADHDARGRNFGFVDGRAIEFDLGSFSQDERLKEEKNVKKTFLLETCKLRRWVHKHRPELLDSFDEKRKNFLTENDETSSISPKEVHNARR